MRLVHRHAALALTVLVAAVLLVSGSGTPKDGWTATPAAAQARIQAPPAVFGGERDAGTSRAEQRPDATSDKSRDAQLAKERKAIAKAEDYKKKVAALGYDPAETDLREIARQIAINVYGWGDDQYACIDKIITKESNWNPYATNPTSGAYGLPQALPGTKMASMGSDWRTNPGTQLRWGLKYMQDRYGTPCNAWAFHLGHNFY